MRFFCKPYSVCETCKVHFEPEPTVRHAELCPAHRKPVVELEDRILRVVNWAKANWEQLEHQAMEQERNTKQMSQEALSKLYALQQNTLQQNIGGQGLSGTGLGAWNK